MDEDDDIKIKKITCWSFVVIIGGILMAVAFFMNWVEISSALTCVNIDGIDILTDKMGDKTVEYSYVVKLIPLLIAIIGACTSILYIFERLGNNRRLNSSQVAIIMLIPLIACIIFLTVGLTPSLFTGNWNTIADEGLFSFSVQVGPLTAITGCFVCMIGGAMDSKE